MNEVLNLMKRMDIEISIDNVWEKLYEERPIFINEGLITTYPTESVVDAICDSFHLRKNGKNKQHVLDFIQEKEFIYIGDAYIKKRCNQEEVIQIILDENEQFIEKISSRMKKYGWLLFRTDKNVENKTIFSFEKQYPMSFNVEKLLYFRDKLYHKAPYDIKEKIIKQGLIPKQSKSPGFINEPRIYLWLDKPDKNNDFLNARGINNFIIVEIDLKKLNPKQLFYIDNRMVDACFTLEPIPPISLKIL